MVLNNNKISAKQLYRLMVTAFLGITCLLMTDISVYFAGRDGILCIIGASILSLLYGILILYLCRKVNWNYSEYANKHFSNGFNKTIYFIFFLRYFIMLLFVVAILLRLVRNELLTEMNYFYILLPILALMAYSVSKGIEARARMTECIVYTILVHILVLAALGVSGVERFYLVPVFNGNIGGILAGSFVLFGLFSPLELILFMSENIETGEEKQKISVAVSRKKVEKSVIWAILTICGINIIYYLISVGNLSTNLIRQQGDAVIRLAKSVNLPYLVFEKQGGLFMVFFVISLFITIFCLSHHTMWMAEKLMGRKNALSYVAVGLITIVGVYAIVQYSDYFHEVAKERETRVEIENREYADSMMIDWSLGKYKVVLSFPTNEGENRFENVSVTSLNELEAEWGMKSDKRLDLSHVQAVIFGETILKSKILFKDVMTFFENEREISESLNVCVTTQKQEEFTEYAKTLSQEPGKYISKMLENNIRYAKTQLKELNLVLYDAEQACLLTKFESEEGKIAYAGNVVVDRNGFVTEYNDESARIMELVMGEEGVTIALDGGNVIRLDKNQYYMNVDIIGEETIRVRLIYSGKISRNSINSYYTESEEKQEEFNMDEVNEILENIIFNRVQELAIEQNCDILGIYKRLAVADRTLWNRYADIEERAKMFEKVYIDVETRYEET